MTTRAPTTRDDDDGPEWWKRAVVYQVWPRSFADADGDGIGDLPGVISKLDYLQRLGVDVLWMSPFYRSPMDDHGYDVSDYQSVDPVFGTLDDADELIAQVHARDMKLVIDVVLNHTSDDHPWFVESRRGTDDPNRDWYWWRPPRDGMVAGTPGAEPTNWFSDLAAGPAWDLDEASGEYYLHLFSRRQPDLNWENVAVREALYAMLRWWLARGVDGFRMDVINFVSKQLPLRDGPPLPGGPYGDGSPSFQCGPRIHEFMRELHAAVIAPDERVLLTVGEMPGVTVEHAVEFTDPANAELDMVFQFEHQDMDHGPGGRFDVRPLTLLDLKASLGRWQVALAERGWNSLYWNNHDQPRVVSRLGCDEPAHRVRSAKLLATVLHLHRGTPYIYQGEEIGMTNYPFRSLSEFDDIGSVGWARQALASGMTEDAVLAALRWASRDNARTPMQWDDTANAGFTTGTPWLPVNPNHVEVNAAAQIDDPDSVFAHYRHLIELRHELPVVALGDFTMLLPNDEHVYAFTRRLDDTELLVIANVDDSPHAADIDDVAGWRGSDVITSTYTDVDAIGDGPIPLRPWEARVHRRTVL